MGISEELQYARLDELYLDAKNPRLGRPEANAMLSQEQVLDRMRSWTLDELATSYLESGFWTHEALLVVEKNWMDILGLLSCRGIVGLQPLFICGRH